MKFRFPLQRVMQFRKTQEDLAQQEFQEALSKLHQEEKILRDMFEAKATARSDAFKTQVQGGKASPSLTQVHDFLIGQDLRIEKQKKRIQEQERKVEEQREILRQKALDRKIMEGLKERKHEEFRVTDKKLEQKAQDDLTIMRFKRKDSE